MHFEEVRNRVSKAALDVVGVVVTYCILLRLKLWQWLPASYLERRVIYDIYGMFEFSGESKTGLVVDVLRVELPDSISQNLKRVDVEVFERGVVLNS